VFTHLGFSFSSPSQTVAASRRKVEKGTTFDPNLIQLREESAQELLAEPRSDSASKLKILSLIETHEQ
jgi:hypothetical protein